MSRFKKLSNWEYWPAFMFYVPNLPYAIYLALRAKNSVFFSATNPAIKHSGNGSESKFSTLELIPEAYKPTSIFIKAEENIDTVLNEVEKHKIAFPLIIKPDIGFRGLLVKRIKSKESLVNYLQKNNCINLIIQEFIDYKNECGIFYHRLPNQEKGSITSITLKKYLTIKGNGTSTLIELIKADARAINYIDLLTKLHFNNLNSILNKDEEKVLSIIGNHAKGTQFIDGNHLIDDELETAIDTFFKKIPNWYYGRVDVKYNSFDLLKQLKEFKVIEINGIISEPTHIYDPNKNTYFQALKEFRKHWKILFEIATLNHKQNNVSYDKLSDFLSSIKRLKKYTQLIKKQSLSV